MLERPGGGVAFPSLPEKEKTAKMLTGGTSGGGDNAAEGNRATASRLPEV